MHSTSFDVRQEMIIVHFIGISENETDQKVSSYFLIYLFTSQEATRHLNNAVEKVLSLLQVTVY